MYITGQACHHLVSDQSHRSHLASTDQHYRSGTNWDQRAILGQHNIPAVLVGNISHVYLCTSQAKPVITWCLISHTDHTWHLHLNAGRGNLSKYIQNYNDTKWEILVWAMGIDKHIFKSSRDDISWMSAQCHTVSSPSGLVRNGD